MSFSHQRKVMVLHWSQNDRKSFQFSRTLLSILANLKNAIILMVSIHPLIFNSSRPLFQAFWGLVPNASVKTDITISHFFFF